MPATPLNANATQSNSGSLTAASTLTTTATIASHEVITTTITSGGTGSLPTAAAISQQQNRSDIPVAAIAGGTVAGVLLALVAVIGWAWWGKCIKRQKAKEVKEALAVLQVRENTRKNATSLSYPAGQYRPVFSLRGPQDRKVTFVSASPSSGQSTLKGTLDSKVPSGDAEKGSTQHIPTPRPPTPAAATQENTQKSESALPLPPPVPRRNPGRGRAPVDSTVSTAPSSYAQHRLVHQPSTLSSGSVYSTQSAIEERQTTGVPSSLLLALGNEDIRRSVLASYLPWNRNRNSTVSQNRLSEYSTGSVYSQYDEQPWEPVGYAYGDEEELTRR